MCEYCKVTCNDGSSILREFIWHYRPRAKCSDKPSDDYVLSVELCDSCYHRVRGFECYGWDRWDALDGLFFTLESSYSTKRGREEDDVGSKRKIARM